MIEDNQYTPWNDFDPLEYAKRNYGSMFPEDKKIIKAVHLALKEYGLKKDQFENGADVGAGPNLYPAMLLSPYVKGKITLIEYSATNRKYLRKIFEDSTHGEYLEHKNNWEKYGQAIAIMLGKDYSEILKNIKEKVEIIEGSIYNLPQGKFSILSSFFCAESITDKPEKFQKALESLINSLTPGGFFIIAHMLGSEGYYAGENTKFPAVNFSEQDFRKAYQSIPSIFDFHLKIAETGRGERKARKGYHSMAVAIGRKKTKSLLELKYLR